MHFVQSNKKGAIHIQITKENSFPITHVIAVAEAPITIISNPFPTQFFLEKMIFMG